MNNLRIQKGTPITPQLRESFPRKFTNPFSYAPHELTLQAMESLCTFVKEQMPHTQQQLQQDGKMMGVLVVESSQGELGYLAAFSGVLETPQNADFFVPPVYDINSPDSFFPSEEALISGINARIKELQEDASVEEYLKETERIKEEHLQKIAQLEDEYQKGKTLRDSLRKLLSDGQHLSDEELSLQLKNLVAYDNLQNPEQLMANLTKESQFQKAEIRRAKQRMKEELEPRQGVLDAHSEQLKQLEQERKERSIALQKKIFEHFIFLNAKGEEKSLLEIFEGVIPPAGAGECAAPRLLQYAYRHGFHPIAMGEFWLGAPTANRQPLHFYPSCKGKCAPILGFMLQGLNVEEAGFHTSYGCDNLPDNFTPEILYEDEYLLAVNKPAGILSQPGKNPQEKNLLQLLERLQQNAITTTIEVPSGTMCSKSCEPNELSKLYIVHRLDMHTSGALLIAKTEEVYKLLQKQFDGRAVEKTYVAVLDGEVSDKLSGRGVEWLVAAADGDGENRPSKGMISLPLIADYENRPLQKVDFECGKEAVTQFEVQAVRDGKTYIEFHPITGRTHQLRVHSASKDGLNAPIVGDLLYGKPAQRLMLHAYKVRFEHPFKGLLEIVAPLPEGF